MTSVDAHPWPPNENYEVSLINSHGMIDQLIISILEKQFHFGTCGLTSNGKVSFVSSDIDILTSISFGCCLYFYATTWYQEIDSHIDFIKIGKNLLLHCCLWSSLSRGKVSGKYFRVYKWCLYHNSVGEETFFASVSELQLVTFCR